MGGIRILGATGRTGRALAARPAGDHELVLVGRVGLGFATVADLRRVIAELG